MVEGFLCGFMFLRVYICGRVAASADGLLHSTICAEGFLVIRVQSLSLSLLSSRQRGLSKTQPELVISSLTSDLCSLQDSSPSQMQAAVTEVPFSLDDLDRTIAAFETIEQLLKSLSPDTWKQDLDSIYTQTHIHYRSRAYHLASRHNKGESLSSHA